MLDIAPAFFSPWDFVSSEIAFLLFAAFVAIAAVVVLAIGALGVPFWKLSEVLHPRRQEALRLGQERRARRIGIAQGALDRTGEVVVGFTVLGVAGAGVIVLLGIRALAFAVVALVVLGLLGAIAERLGLIDPA